MLPVIAILGRPNVGKSTLFNRLTQTRKAVVADLPGVTRDRQYGVVSLDEQQQCVLIDTGGLAVADETKMEIITREQVQLAMAEADYLLFIVDAHAGLTAADEEIASAIRRCNKPVLLVVNKIDGVNLAVAGAEFYELGLGDPQYVAANQGRGFNEFKNTLRGLLPQVETPVVAESKGIQIAIVGRPNVGKSTLINRLLGEERVVVSEEAGTTRDSIFIPFERRGQQYTLIDTAGIRRRGKIKQAAEKFSVIKALQAIEQADVVILLLNGQENVTDQDLRIIGLILESGKAVVLAVNKWDHLEEDQREFMKKEIDRRLPFLSFARRYFISALHGTAVGKLYGAIAEAYDSLNRELSTGQITQALERAIEQHQPPLVGGRRIRLRYAHVGSRNPLKIVIHGKQVEKLPGSYQRYLASFFRKRFDLVGVPILIRYKSDANPYVDEK